MKSLLAFISGTTLFGKGIILSLSSLIVTLVSMKAALTGLVILILVDLLSGIRANLHTQGIPFNPFKKSFWKSIKSYLLRKTWKKAYEYGLGIVVVATLETLVLGAPMSIILMERAFTLAELAVIVPAIVEVWSVFENFEKVSGKNMLKRMQLLLPKQFRELLQGKKQELDEDSIN